MTAKTREGSKALLSADGAIRRQLPHLLKDPTRIKALAIYIERAASPKEISDELRVTINAASHHTKELHKMGLIELIEEQPRRGATAHFYRAVMRPIWSDVEWGELSQEERQRYAAWTVQLANLDVADAMQADTYQARVETHTSRAIYQVDEQGWSDLNAILNKALEDSFNVEAESAERLASNKGKSIHARAVMFCVEMPNSSRR